MKKIIIIALLALFALPILATEGPVEGKPEKCEMVSQLYGVWEFNQYPYDIIDNIHRCGNQVNSEGAFLTYIFKEDGTYTKSFGDNQNKVFQTGIWDVSEDHQFLILIDSNSGSEDLQVSSIRITSDDTLDISENFEFTKDLEQYVCSALNIFSMPKTAETLLSLIK